MIKETKVCGKLLQEIHERLAKTKDVINLDNADVAWCVKDREGFVYEGQQEEESSTEFLKSFLTELAAMENVSQSTRSLLHLTVENPSIDEMNEIDRFLQSFRQENFELKLGLRKKESAKTRITAVFTH